MKNFGEKETWAYPGTAQIVWVPPITSGTRKATDFKFGQYIQRVRPNKILLKILEKGKRRRIQGLPIFRVPLLSREWGKLRISNLASTFRVSIRSPNKSPSKILEKRERGIHGLPNFSGTPLSQERVKLRTSNFACTFIGSIGSWNKSPLKFREK